MAETSSSSLWLSSTVARASMSRPLTPCDTCTLRCRSAIPRRMVRHCRSSYGPPLFGSIAFEDLCLIDGRLGRPHYTPLLMVGLVVKLGGIAVHPEFHPFSFPVFLQVAL